MFTVVNFCLEASGSYILYIMFSYDKGSKL